MKVRVILFGLLAVVGAGSASYLYIQSQPNNTLTQIDKVVSEIPRQPLSKTYRDEALESYIDAFYADTSADLLLESLQTAGWTEIHSSTNTAKPQWFYRHQNGYCADIWLDNTHPKLPLKASVFHKDSDTCIRSFGNGGELIPVGEEELQIIDTLEPEQPGSAGQLSEPQSDGIPVHGTIDGDIEAIPL